MRSTRYTKIPLRGGGDSLPSPVEREADRMALTPGAATATLKLSPIEKRFLLLLRERCAGPRWNGANTCVRLGAEIWCEPGRRLYGGSQGGNRWARNAGRVLNGLDRKGLVSWFTVGTGHTPNWRLTGAGEAEVDLLLQQKESSAP